MTDQYASINYSTYSTGQLGALSSKELWAMTIAQIQTLSVAQLGAILTNRNYNQTALFESSGSSGWSEDQVQCIAPKTIGDLGDNVYLIMDKLSQTQMSGLTGYQLGKYYSCINWNYAGNTNAFSATVISQAGFEWVSYALKVCPDLGLRLSATQIAAIDISKGAPSDIVLFGSWISKFSNAQFNQLSGSQLDALLLNASTRDALANVNGINGEGPGVTLTQLQQISPQTISSLTVLLPPTCLLYLSTTQIGALTGTQVTAILNNTASRQVLSNIGGAGPWWSFSQFCSLSPQGQAAVATYANNRMPLVTVTNNNCSFSAPIAFLNINVFLNYSNAQMSNLDGNSLLAIVQAFPSIINIGTGSGWSPTQFQSIIPAALVNLGNLIVLLGKAIAWLTTNQISNGISLTQFIALLQGGSTQGVITTLSDSGASTGHWTPAQFRALNSQFFASMTFAQLQLLSHQDFANMTAVQVQAIAPSVIAQMTKDMICAFAGGNTVSPGGNIANFTTAQVQAIAPTVLSQMGNPLVYFSVNQVALFILAQVSALIGTQFTFQLIALLTVAQRQAISSTAITQMGTNLLTYFTPAQVANFCLAQITALSFDQVLALLNSKTFNGDSGIFRNVGSGGSGTWSLAQYKALSANGNSAVAQYATTNGLVTVNLTPTILVPLEFLSNAVLTSLGTAFFVANGYTIWLAINKATDKSQLTWFMGNANLPILLAVACSIQNNSPASDGNKTLVSFWGQISPLNQMLLAGSSACIGAFGSLANAINSGYGSLIVFILNQLNSSQVPMVDQVTIAGLTSTQAPQLSVDFYNNLTPTQVKSLPLSVIEFLSWDQRQALSENFLTSLNEAQVLAFWSSMVASRQYAFLHLFADNSVANYFALVLLSPANITQYGASFEAAVSSGLQLELSNTSQSKEASLGSSSGPTDPQESNVWEAMSLDQQIQYVNSMAGTDALSSLTKSLNNTDIANALNVGANGLDKNSSTLSTTSVRATFASALTSAQIIAYWVSLSTDNQRIFIQSDTIFIQSTTANSIVKIFTNNLSYNLGSFWQAMSLDQQIQYVTINYKDPAAQGYNPTADVLRNTIGQLDNGDISNALNIGNFGLDKNSAGTRAKFASALTSTQINTYWVGMDAANQAIFIKNADSTLLKNIVIGFTTGTLVNIFDTGNHMDGASSISQGTPVFNGLINADYTAFAMIAPYISSIQIQGWWNSLSKEDQCYFFVVEGQYDETPNTYLYNPNVGFVFSFIIQNLSNQQITTAITDATKVIASEPNYFLSFVIAFVSLGYSKVSEWVQSLCDNSGLISVNNFGIFIDVIQYEPSGTTDQFYLSKISIPAVQNWFSQNNFNSLPLDIQKALFPLLSGGEQGELMPDNFSYFDISKVPTENILQWTRAECLQITTKQWGSLLISNQKTLIAEGLASRLNASVLNALDPSLVSMIPLSEISGLPVDFFKNISTNSAVAFTLQQIWNMTGDQLGALGDNIVAFPDAGIVGLTNAQIDGLTSGQIGEMRQPGSVCPLLLEQYFATPENIGAYTPIFLAELNPAMFQDLTELMVEQFTAVQCLNLTFLQYNEIPKTLQYFLQYPPISYLSQSQFSKLADATVQALTPASIATLGANQIGYFSAAQIALLSPQQLALIPATTVNDFDSATWGLFSSGQKVELLGGVQINLAVYLNILPSLTMADRALVVPPNPSVSLSSLSPFSPIANNTARTLYLVAIQIQMIANMLSTEAAQAANTVKTARGVRFIGSMFAFGAVASAAESAENETGGDKSASIAQAVAWAMASMEVPMGAIILGINGFNTALKTLGPNPTESQIKTIIAGAQKNVLNFQGVKTEYGDSADQQAIKNAQTVANGYKAQTVTGSFVNNSVFLGSDVSNIIANSMAAASATTTLGEVTYIGGAVMAGFLLAGHTLGAFASLDASTLSALGIGEAAELAKFSNVLLGGTFIAENLFGDAVSVAGALEAYMSASTTGNTVALAGTVISDAVTTTLTYIGAVGAADPIVLAVAAVAVSVNWSSVGSAIDLQQEEDNFNSEGQPEMAYVCSELYKIAVNDSIPVWNWFSGITYDPAVMGTLYSTMLNGGMLNALKEGYKYNINSTDAGKYQITQLQTLLENSQSDQKLINLDIAQADEASYYASASSQLVDFVMQLSVTADSVATDIPDNWAVESPGMSAATIDLIENGSGTVVVEISAEVNTVESLIVDASLSSAPMQFDILTNRATVKVGTGATTLIIDVALVTSLTFNNGRPVTIILPTDFSTSDSIQYTNTTGLTSFLINLDLFPLIPVNAAPDENLTNTVVGTLALETYVSGGGQDRVTMSGGQGTVEIGGGGEQVTMSGGNNFVYAELGMPNSTIQNLSANNNEGSYDGGKMVAGVVAADGTLLSGENSISFLGSVDSLGLVINDATKVSYVQTEAINVDGTTNNFLDYAKFTNFQNITGSNLGDVISLTACTSIDRLNLGIGINQLTINASSNLSVSTNEGNNTIFVQNDSNININTMDGDNNISVTGGSTLNAFLQGVNDFVDASDALSTQNVTIYSGVGERAIILASSVTASISVVGGNSITTVTDEQSRSDNGGLLVMTLGDDLANEFVVWNKNANEISFYTTDGSSQVLHYCLASGAGNFANDNLANIEYINAGTISSSETSIQYLIEAMSAMSAPSSALCDGAGNQMGYSLASVIAEVRVLH